MTLLDLVLLLVIAGICGAIGKTIAGTPRGGCGTSIAIGFIGALFGHWIAKKLDLPEFLPVRFGEEPGAKFPIVWSIIGAALFMSVIGLITRRPPPPPQ